MGGYTLVETRFNLYKLDICLSGHSILVNFSPLNIIAYQEVVIVKNFQKVLTNYDIYYFLSSRDEIPIDDFLTIFP